MNNAPMVTSIVSGLGFPTLLRKELLPEAEKALGIDAAARERLKVDLLEG